MDVAVVIPTYNEAATIAAVVQRGCRQVDWVIVVDDGSEDATAVQLKELPAMVLRHEDNQGKAASLWDGMQLALAQGAKAVITLDADGQHCPEDIPRLLAAGQRYPAALIIAARLHGWERSPWLRRLANRIADFWISWAAGCPIADTQSGFRLYPAVVCRLPIGHDRRHGFVFESEILIEAARHGYYPIAVPIKARYSRQGRCSYYQPLRDTVRITRMVAWKLLSRGLYPLGLLRSLRLLTLFDTPSL
ncbi:MAG TPA: glycosyltransferase family 2 protein, partial [Candidatus Competibacteraceae bacterium]|nr:glycosyltransferase family 2 protein [Candidatus Competibacteraceae bacterium]